MISGIEEIFLRQILALIDLKNISEIACSAPYINNEQTGKQKQALLIKFITGSRKIDGY